MKYFIFRNNTIEPYFTGEEYAFSGYDDISSVPEDADTYIWFYQLPVKFDKKALAEEIDAFTDRLALTVDRIPAEKQIIVFTLVDIFDIRFFSSDFSTVQAVSRFNAKAIELSKSRKNVRIVDFSRFTNLFPVSEMIPWKFYFISQMELDPRLAVKFRKWWNAQRESIALKRKKCLVLDLDNTLWGGVLGEEGVHGIQIGGDYPGKAFLYFQNGLKQLAAHGIILTVCSKNNEKDVMDAWEENPFILLRKKDFAAMRINWNDKASNIAELAKELNIGLDSMVFIDDNPTERELIKQMLPMVEVPDFPAHPYLLPVFLKDLVEKYFTVYALTEEDLSKTEQYKANAARTAEMSHFSNMDDYLRSLGINITIARANDFNTPRIAQMTQKTNQFNLTTHRLDESQIRKYVSEGWRIWCISVSDKFGDNGITGAIFVDSMGFIDNMVLSCRILGKGIEHAFLNSILGILEKDFTRITAKYIKSPKNSQVADFYKRAGFVCGSENESGKEYYLDMTSFRPVIKDFYNINIE